MADQRTKALIVLAVLLGATRFIAVPWASSQNEKHERLELVTERLDRSKALLSGGKGILASEKDLEASVSVAQAIFPSINDVAAFRLDTQRKVSSIAQANGATVSLFEWLLDGAVPGAQLSFGKVRLSLEGPLEKLVGSHGALEAEMPYAMTRELDLDADSSLVGLDNTEARLNLTMDIYFRPYSEEARAQDGS